MLIIIFKYIVKLKIKRKLKLLNLKLKTVASQIKYIIIQTFNFP